MENKNFKEDFLNIRILMNHKDFKKAELEINKLESLNKVKKISLLILKRDLFFLSNDLLKAYLISKEIIQYFENLKSKLPKRSKFYFEYCNSLYISVNYHYSKKHYDKVIKDLNKILELENYIDNLLIISKLMMKCHLSLQDYDNYNKWKYAYISYLDIIFDRTDPIITLNQYLPYELISNNTEENNHTSS